MTDRPRFAMGGVIPPAPRSRDDDSIPAILSPGWHAFPHGRCGTCGHPLVLFESGGIEHLISATGIGDGDDEGEKVWAEICEAHGGEENVDG